jgi:hypothetical protein
VLGVLDSIGEVGLNEVHLDVDITLVVRLVEGEQSNNIGMVQFPEVHDFPIGALAVGGIAKGVEDAFEGAGGM